jgi:hypothetical protein
MRNYFKRGFLPLYCLDGDGGDGGGDGGGGGGDAGFVGSDGTFNEGWASGEAFKENSETLSRFKNVTDMANSYMDLRKKSSKNPDLMVEIPGENSSDETKAAWSKANGVPESVDGYEYNYSEDFATKLGPLDDTKMAAIKEFAHKDLGLSTAKYQKLLDFYHTNIATDIDTSEASLAEMTSQRFEDGTAVLEGQWLEGKDERTAAALAHLQKYGEIEVKGADGQMINPLEKLFEEAPQLKQSPWLTMIMDSMAQKMGEAGRVGGKDTGALSADGINSQIAEIRAQQAGIREKSPVNFKSDPQFKNLEGRLRQLYQKKPA